MTRLIAASALLVILATTLEVLAQDELIGTWEAVIGPEVEIAVSHGCEPVGLERTVTKASGSVVEEIDGQPAWSMDAVPWRALRSARRLGGFPTCYCLTNSHAELPKFRPRSL